MSRIYGIACILVVIFCPLTAPVSAQQAEKLFKKGDQALQRADMEAAAKFYEEGLVSQPDHVRGNMQMGNLLLRQKQTEPALTFLRKANQLAAGQVRELPFLLAEAYQVSSHFDSAIVHYQIALQGTRKKDYEQVERIGKRILECQAGQELQRQPVEATVSQVKGGINSLWDDHVPVPTDQGNMLIFISRRPSSVKNPEGKQTELYEDVYSSQLENGIWGVPRKFAAPINSVAHDAVLGISADGNELYLYKPDKGRGIQVSRKTPAGNWAEAVPLGEPFDNPPCKPSFSVSDDGLYAFFASDREGGMGGLDLYITLRQPDGSWSEALNLGPAINTPYDENAPSIDSKNNVLYFSSRGHNSMGGYDIFRSSINGALWTQAVNMGMPVNSPSDDLHFMLMPDEQSGYFASDRPGSLGGKDIYLASFRQQSQNPDSIAVAPEPLYVSAEPEQHQEPAPVAGGLVQKASLYLEGIVMDGITGQSLPASITVFDQTSQEVVARVNTDSLGATYAVQLDRGRNYGLLVEKAGYFFYTDYVNLPLNSQEEVLRKNFVLQKLTAGANLVLHNILFAFDKLEFTAETKTELDLLYQLLTDNAHLKIEISGHTDNRGAVEVNQRLSEQRAQAVVQHLTERGINTDRLRAVGHGLARPIASNQTEEGRQRNRRTEFSILSNELSPTAAIRPAAR